MPAFIAKELVQTLLKKGKNLRQARVLILGVTFKENVSDIRNSKVIDVARELMDYGINVQLYDPMADPNEVAHEYAISLIDNIGSDYDAVVVAVGHREFHDMNLETFRGFSRDELILFDLKGIYSRQEAAEGEIIWRL
jgi:UDP-N-acetyl-D-galactosamine dehydrogenase